MIQTGDFMGIKGMASNDEQMDGLSRLAKMIAKKEVNVAVLPSVYKDTMGRRVQDVCYLIALHTPSPSQIVYNGEDYDVWTVEPTIDGPRLHMQKPGLTMKQAAEVVIAEYFLAKAARIKAASPDIEIDAIMHALWNGYQKKTAWYQKKKSPG